MGKKKSSGIPGCLLYLIFGFLILYTIKYVVDIFNKQVASIKNDPESVVENILSWIGGLLSDLIDLAKENGWVLLLLIFVVLSILSRIFGGKR